MEKRLTENQIQKQILDFLKKCGIWCWRSNSQGRLSPKGGRVPAGLAGLPDISGVLPNGKAFFIEVKTLKGRVKPEQQAWLEQCAKNNCIAFVARSVEDAQKLLDWIDYRDI